MSLGELGAVIDDRKMIPSSLSNLVIFCSVTQACGVENQLRGNRVVLIAARFISSL